MYFYFNAIQDHLGEYFDIDKKGRFVADWGKGGFENTKYRTYKEFESFGDAFECCVDKLKNNKYPHAKLYIYEYYGEERVLVYFRLRICEGGNYVVATSVVDEHDKKSYPV